MEKEWNVLIVSPVMLSRECLTNSLQSLPVNAFTVTTGQQARAMLSSLHFELMFCDENTQDGSYRQLLDTVVTSYKETKFILLLSTTAWEEYAKAMSLGVSAVVARPLEPSDVQDVMLQAIRGELVEQSGSVGA